MTGRAPAALPVLVALPDDGHVRLDATGTARAPRMVVPGTAVFTSHLPAAVPARLPMVYVRAGQRLAGMAADIARSPGDENTAAAFGTGGHGETSV